jgi:hypothetical protein
MWSQAYLINLPERHDRLNYALWELGTVGIKPEVVPAIKSDKSEMSCKLSHLSIMKKALAQSLTPLIIEDDLWIQGIVEMNKEVDDDLKKRHQDSVCNFWQRIKIYEHMLDQVNWDIFFFYCDLRFITDDVINKVQHDDSDCLIEGPTYCTHFYVINKNSLEKVIRVIEEDKENFAIDKIFIVNSIKKQMNLEKEFALYFKYKKEMLEKRKTNELKIYCASKNLVCQCINFKTSIKENETHMWNGNLNGIFNQRW